MRFLEIIVHICSRPSLFARHLRGQDTAGSHSAQDDTLHLGGEVAELRHRVPRTVVIDDGGFLRKDESGQISADFVQRIQHDWGTLTGSHKARNTPLLSQYGSLFPPCTKATGIPFNLLAGSNLLLVSGSYAAAPHKRTAKRKSGGAPGLRFACESIKPAARAAPCEKPSTPSKGPFAAMKLRTRVCADWRLADEIVGEEPASNGVSYHAQKFSPSKRYSSPVKHEIERSVSSRLCDSSVTDRIYQVQAVWVSLLRDRQTRRLALCALALPVTGQLAGAGRWRWLPAREGRECAHDVSVPSRIVQAFLRRERGPGKTLDLVCCFLLQSSGELWG